MSNRIYYIMCSLIQNSKLSRENFVNNKKKYNVYKTKTNQQNFNHVISRKLHTNSSDDILSFGKPGGKGPKLSTFVMFITAISCYISANINKKK